MSGIVAFLATATGLMVAWPQVARIVIRKDDTGVSLLTRRLNLCAGVSWLAIGIVNDIAATIVFNSVGLIGGTAILVAMARLHRRSLLPIVYVFAGIVAVNVAVYLAFGKTGTGVLGSSFTIVMFLPQIWKAARQPVTGVSPVAWGLAVFSFTCWGVYGLMLDQWELIYPNVVLISGSAFIFYKALQSNTALTANRQPDVVDLDASTTTVSN